MITIRSHRYHRDHGFFFSITDYTNYTNMNNLEQYKKDYNKLVALGKALYYGFICEFKEHETIFSSYKNLSKEFRELGEQNLFSLNYHRWYNESLRLIKQLLPERLDDFVGYYNAPKNRKAINLSNYPISDCLIGYRVTNYGAVIVEPVNGFVLFQQQLHILLSIKGCFESSLFNIKELLQADIFDSELDGARELQKNGFYRAAGALCGVILEKHFAGVCSSHAIKMKKAAPGISDYNYKLKEEAVIENKTFLLIQRLGAIRNLCDHNKKQEPMKDDIDDLINGTDKILHEVL